MGARERSNKDDADGSEVDINEELHESNHPLCGQGDAIDLRLSLTTLDSFRGDILSALPFTRSPNAYNSVDECMYGQSLRVCTRLTI